MKLTTLTACLVIIISGCHTKAKKEAPASRSMSLTASAFNSIAVSTNEEIEILKQKIWEGLEKVPGTNNDYVSNIKLRISEGNTIDADCKLMFPESAWELAATQLVKFQEVLQNTNIKIFEIIHRLITDPKILASEIRFTGLWRPFCGSDVHKKGRGIDIGDIRSSLGSGAIFNKNTSAAENDFAKAVRVALTTQKPVIINQYFSPWIMCTPITKCTANKGQTVNEKTHLNHLHLTLNP